MYIYIYIEREIHMLIVVYHDIRLHYITIMLHYIILYKCKGIGRQGMVLKRRNSLQKEPMPVVLCPYLCSSERKRRPGGTKRATSVNVPVLSLQSSEWTFTMSREIEPVRRSLRRHKVARLRKWHVWCLLDFRKHGTSAPFLQHDDPSVVRTS